MVDIGAHHVCQQRVELAVMAEHDVTTEVPGEAGRIDDRPGQAAHDRLTFIDGPVTVTEQLQLAGTGQSAGAGADDRDPGCLVDRHGGRY